jgi:predicted DNA-binding ribbon-helix-helix protein
MDSPVIKRSVVIAGQKTSVSLEDAFWIALKEIAASRQMNLSELVTSIDHDRQQGNLSSCLRLFVLDFYVGRVRAHEEPPEESSAADEPPVAGVRSA